MLINMNGEEVPRGEYIVKLEAALKVQQKEIKTLRYQRDGLRDAARELLARLDSSPERILMEAAIAASEDK
jgi:hypothetical protein